MTEDCGLFKKGKLDGAEMDMIFTRCKNPARHIPFDKFKAQGESGVGIIPQKFCPIIMSIKRILWTP